MSAIWSPPPSGGSTPPRHHAPHPSPVQRALHRHDHCGGLRFQPLVQPGRHPLAEDTTRDCWGTFVFLRDVASGEVWSAGFQPRGTEADHYDVVYSEDRVKITQRHPSLSIVLEIVVSTRTTRSFGGSR